MEKSNVKVDGCLVFDIVGMNDFNAAFGWNVGDELIRKIRNMIEEHCSFLAFTLRVIGDEFIITTSDVAESALEEVATTLSSGIHRKLGVSVAYGSGAGDSAPEARKVAMLALFENQNRGIASKRRL